MEGLDKTSKSHPRHQIVSIGMQANDIFVVFESRFEKDGFGETPPSHSYFRRIFSIVRGLSLLLQDKSPTIWFVFGPFYKNFAGLTLKGVFLISSAQLPETIPQDSPIASSSDKTPAGFDAKSLPYHAPSVIFIASAHLISLLGFWTFSVSSLVLCLVFHLITGLGITLGYHRLLTHRGFQTPKWVEYFFSICGVLACQGSPLTWVAVHRLHHAASDQGMDPHSPRHGFFWAHMGWSLKEVAGIRTFEDKVRYAPDLAKDPFHLWLDRYFMLPTAVLTVILWALGGWHWVVWGVFIRLVLLYHCTWFVNSASHVWGYKTYQSGDDSTNLWWVALLTYGEGWHNNHHAFQSSARHGLQWWEIDVTYAVIQCLKWAGLAESIKLPSQYLLNSKRQTKI